QDARALEQRDVGAPSAEELTEDRPEVLADLPEGLEEPALALRVEAAHGLVQGLARALQVGALAGQEAMPLLDLRELGHGLQVDRSEPVEVLLQRAHALRQRLPGPTLAQLG